MLIRICTFHLKCKKPVREIALKQKLRQKRARTFNLAPVSARIFRPEILRKPRSICIASAFADRLFHLFGQRSGDSFCFSDRFVIGRFGRNLDRPGFRIIFVSKIDRDLSVVFFIGWNVCAVGIIFIVRIPGFAAIFFRSNFAVVRDFAIVRSIPARVH